MNRSLTRPIWKTCGWWIGLFVLLVWSPHAGHGQTKSIFRDGLNAKSFVSRTQGAWQISALRLTHDRKTNVYMAEGDVRITSGDRSMQANWAQLNAETQQVELRGNVLLVYGKDWLKGEQVFWNLENETGWVDGGMAYFSENHFYVQGKVIAKTGETTYELKEGFLTTCDPSNADWRVRYRQMKIDTDGLAWARGTSFLVRDIPVLYTPIVVLPIQQQRQSGFLIPWGGYTKLNGFEGELPFYWAMREDMDATLYGRYMVERGWMTGAEYRISNETWGEGIWIVNFLHDQADKVHLREHGFPFQKEDRYWIRSRHSFHLPYQIQGRLDLDVVSDKNYLKEFKDGSTSYDYTNDLFRKFFGRGILNDEYTLTRESSLYMDRRTESTLLSMDVRYWDQLDRSLDEFTLQRLPAFGFDVVPSWIEGSPLYYSLGSSWVNYWRREGDQGSRADLYPRVYYPLHWKNYLDFEPSAGVRTISYTVDWEENSRGQLQQRVLPDVQLDVSSRLNRVYDVKLGNVVALQHAVRPQVIYEYRPEWSSGNIPRFDRLDDMEERHGISYGVTNFLTSKVVQRDAKGDTVTSYREWARLQIFQTWNIEPAVSEMELQFNPDAEKTHFSDVNMLLDIIPGRYITLTYDTGFDPEEGDASRHDVYTTLDSGRGHILQVGYQFWKDSLANEFIARSDIKVLPNVYVRTYHDYSIERNELFKQGYGLRYLRGCWGLELAYEREAEDQRIAFSINLLGLGDFGGSYSLGDIRPWRGVLQ